MYRQFAVVLIGALLIFAAACGSDSPSGPEDQGEPTSSLECSAPALAATEAVPFSRVTLTGVSGIDQDTWVDYTNSPRVPGTQQELTDTDAPNHPILFYKVTAPSSP